MEKVFIKDKQGNKVLPITHISAVLDDNGNDIGSVMGAFEDEVRGLVDTPHQEYVTVATYASLPASGSKDTIYRVSNYNGSTSQVATDVYSEYAWDGTQYVFLCVKTQIGEVFDITVYNNNTKYADLAAALGTGGANIPEGLRKGGMSVKFVCSSDNNNKYVQYRFLLSSFNDSQFINILNWESIDDKINDVENNLNDLENYLGYPINYFDARLFTTSNTTNWSISTTKDSITITHNNQWDTGEPKMELNVPSGNYVFKYQSDLVASNGFGLYINGSYSRTLTNNSQITIESGLTYTIYCPTIGSGSTITITNISLISLDRNERIKELEENVENLDRIFDIFGEVPELMTKISSIVACIEYNGNIASNVPSTYHVYSYDLTNINVVYITANAVWGNAFYAFYDENNNVLLVSERSVNSNTGSRITDRRVVVPDNAKTLKISFVDGVYKPESYAEKVSGFTEKKWSGKKWVCVGDSLTESYDVTSIHYFEYVKNETGITTINMGVSGSGYARLSESNKAFYQRISSIDTSADVVTIFGSFNDLGSPLPLGTVTDNDTTTIAGCINKTIDNLFDVMPLANLGIVSPTPWDSTQPTVNSTADAYVNLLKGICERRSIPFMNLFIESGLRPWDSSFRALAYSKDGGSGTHPDETGHKIIAPKFEAFLDKLLMH